MPSWTPLFGWCFFWFSEFEKPFLTTRQYKEVRKCKNICEKLPLASVYSVKFKTNLFCYWRIWIANNELFFCEWDIFRRQSEVGELMWNREENLPHCIQCVLILSMAVERYILICYPARSQKLLSSRVRCVFYILITMLISALGGIFAAAYHSGFVVAGETKDRYEKNFLHETLNVGNHAMIQKLFFLAWSARLNKFNRRLYSIIDRYWFELATQLRFQVLFSGLKKHQCCTTRVS